MDYPRGCSRSLGPTIGPNPLSNTHWREFFVMAPRGLPLSEYFVNNLQDADSTSPPFRACIISGFSFLFTTVSRLLLFAPWGTSKNVARQPLKRDRNRPETTPRPSLSLIKSNCYPCPYPGQRDGLSCSLQSLNQGTSRGNEWLLAHASPRPRILVITDAKRGERRRNVTPTCHSRRCLFLPVSREWSPRESASSCKNRRSRDLELLQWLEKRKRNFLKFLSVSKILLSHSLLKKWIFDVEETQTVPLSLRFK